MLKKNFNPLLFLSSLGAGGIAVMPFAFFQYTVPHGKGLITIDQLRHGSNNTVTELLYYSMETVMVLFILVHFILTFIYIKGYITWKRSEQYNNMLNNPLANASLLTPVISLTMSMNVLIGPIRFFFPVLNTNLQHLMLPALAVWSVIWSVGLATVIKLQKISFEKNFDINKINFGWLLHPFALGMITVTGTGIAALSKNSTVAHIAAFMSLVSGTMGFFLLKVKLVSIFKSHFASTGLPEKQFLPSFLIVIPNITLYAISAFRLGHYAEHQFNTHLGIYFTVIMVIAFAFETWYLLFGLSLLKDYFRKHFFTNEFYVSQWGLVCPFVAYAVLGSFTYKVFIPNQFLLATIILSMAVSVSLFALLLTRQLRCSGLVKKEIECFGFTRG